MAMVLRPDDTMILYNIACVFCLMNNAKDAMIALKKARAAGYSNAAWARQDPDLALLHGDPEFERLFPNPTPTKKKKNLRRSESKIGLIGFSTGSTTMSRQKPLDLA